MINPSDPAYPVADIRFDVAKPNDAPCQSCGMISAGGPISLAWMGGMTIRLAVASQCLAALLANPKESSVIAYDGLNAAARAALAAADALINAANKEQS